MAHTFVAEGCTRLILADVNGEGLQTVAKELEELDDSVQTCLVTCDISQEDQVQKMVDDGVAKFGAIHYAVNNAGISSKPRVRTHELEVESYDRVQNVNQRGLWLCERAELRQMLKQEPELRTRLVLSIRKTAPRLTERCDRAGTNPQRGSIVNISSIFGRVSHENVGAVSMHVRVRNIATNAELKYAATKAAVLGITRTDACAYGKDGIRVNSVCPGYIRTPCKCICDNLTANVLTVTVLDHQIKIGTYDEGMIKAIPIHRWGVAEDIAEGVVFLASEKASFITGEELYIDGGSVIKCHG